MFSKHDSTINKQVGLKWQAGGLQIHKTVFSFDVFVAGLCRIFFQIKWPIDGEYLKISGHFYLMAFKNPYKPAIFRWTKTRGIGQNPW